MAKIAKDFVAKFQTTKDGDMEETQFKAGDDISVVQTWQNHFLIKDKNGHFYNVAKELIQK